MFVLSSIIDNTYYGFDDMSNTAGVLLETGIAYSSRAPGFTPGFLVGSVLPIC